MDETRIVELLTRKIAGEASAEELGELSYLLTKYPDSVYYEALLEQVWELGRNETRHDLDDAFKRHKLKYKGDLKFNRPSYRFKELFSRPAIFAIGFVCLFFSAAAFILDKYDQRVPKPRVEIVAGKGVRKEIKLPDGTIVHLNSDSRISYHPDMVKKGERDVTIAGEAFFKIAQDEDHPFIVRTRSAIVEALGTEFNIKEYAVEQKLETTLLKGSVELTLKSRSDQKFILKPLEKFTVLGNGEGHTAAQNSVITIKRVIPLKDGRAEQLAETAWTGNKLVLQNEALEELVPRLERWYNVKIELNDQRLKSLRFTGAFNDENIVQTLEAMRLINSFNYELTANRLRIY